VATATDSDLDGSTQQLGGDQGVALAPITPNERRPT
jgi:hypothetical protein